jgi:hypothetical protein
MTALIWRQRLTRPHLHQLHKAGRACLIGALVVALAGIVVQPRAHGEEVYRSVDASGNVVYSDHPTSPTSSKLTVPVRAADPAEAARLAKQHALEDADYAQRTKLEAEEQSKQAAQAKQQAERCSSAKNHYFSIKDARRLFHVGADGDRVFYSDEEADAMRATAKQAMDQACGT